jgi:hypothetical protein
MWREQEIHHAFTNTGRGHCPRQQRRSRDTSISSRLADRVLRWLLAAIKRDYAFPVGYEMTTHFH